MHAGSDVNGLAGFLVFLSGASIFIPEDSHEDFSVEVNWGDGGDFEHALQHDDHSIEASHVYGTAGVYTVTLRISSHEGSTATDTMNFFITTGG